MSPLSPPCQKVACLWNSHLLSSLRALSVPSLIVVNPKSCLAQSLSSSLFLGGYVFFKTMFGDIQWSESIAL